MNKFLDSLLPRFEGTEAEALDALAKEAQKGLNEEANAFFASIGDGSKVTPFYGQGHGVS